MVTVAIVYTYMHINEQTVPTYLFHHLLKLVFLILAQFLVVFNRGYVEAILCFWFWGLKGAGQNG